VALEKCENQEADNIYIVGGGRVFPTRPGRLVTRCVANVDILGPQVYR
jgi:hypothetical protein